MRSSSLQWQARFLATGQPCSRYRHQAIPLVMLFAIQRTQGTAQAATQRKLDELIRALALQALEHCRPPW